MGKGSDYGVPVKSSEAENKDIARLAPISCISQTFVATTKGLLTYLSVPFLILYCWFLGNLAETSVNFCFRGRRWKHALEPSVWRRGCFLPPWSKEKWLKSGRKKWFCLPLPMSLTAVLESLGCDLSASLICLNFFWGTPLHFHSLSQVLLSSSLCFWALNLL